MHSLHETGKFGHILVYSYALLCHSSCIGMGSGMCLTNAPFRIDKVHTRELLRAAYLCNQVQ